MSLTIIKIGASSFTDFSQANGTDPLGFHGIPPSEVPHRGRLDANDSVGTDEHQVSVQCGVLARLEGIERLSFPVRGRINRRGKRKLVGNVCIVCRQTTQTNLWL